MIVVEGVTKSYGAVQALKGIALQVDAGNILALLGPNGAGKTTLIRILTTLLRPDGGRASVGGHNVVRSPDAVRSIIGLAGQYAAVDDNLTGYENLAMVGRLYHLGRAECGQRAVELLERFRLSDAANRRVKTYSGGMRRRLDLAASLVARPQILFMDEPTTGLDPRSRMDLWDTIIDLVTGGMTMLLTTQYLEEADRLANFIVVIDQGRVIAEGTGKQLKASVGGEVLHLQVANRLTATVAAEAIASFGSSRPRVDSATGEVSLPVHDGTSVLPAVVRRLDSAGVTLSDLSLRQPSLDDVFIALTGRAPDAPPDRTSASKRGKRISIPFLRRRG